MLVMHLPLFSRMGYVDMCVGSKEAETTQGVPGTVTLCLVLTRLPCHVPRFSCPLPSSAGRVVYFGDASKALTLFEEAGVPCPPLRNPTDHFLHVINTDFSAGPEAGGHASQPSQAAKDIDRLVELYTSSRLPDVDKRASEVCARVRDS